jgi:hypothetical protein
LAANKVEGYQIQMGPKLQLDPVSESFVGRDAPNQWLTREYRAPYIIPSENAV